MAVIKAPPPPQLAHLIEVFGFDDQTGDFAIVWKRPMAIVRVVGESDIDMVGAKFPVGRILKVFVKPMEQAPTDKKEVGLV